MNLGVCPLEPLRDGRVLDATDARQLVQRARCRRVLGATHAPLDGGHERLDQPLLQRVLVVGGEQL